VFILPFSAELARTHRRPIEFVPDRAYPNSPEKKQPSASKSVAFEVKPRASSAGVIA
jgi:hypothetical protein